jgi:hypothetical protein
VTIDQGTGDLAVTPDGTRAYTTHSSYSYFTNPDGSHTTPQGYLSAVELPARGFERVPITGGGTGNVAVTPDGRLVYTTVSSPPLGSVAVIDTQTNTVLTSILLSGVAGDVVVAPVPSTAAASPTPRPARVIIRADSVTGVVSDDVPIVVRIDSGGLDVDAVEHDLITTWNAPLLASQLNASVPDCSLNPGIAAVASFEFPSPSCTYRCARVHVRIQATEPGASLPHNGVLYTCTANLLYFVPGLRPILITGATATDLVGQPLPVFAADSEIRVLSQYDATPRPRRTRPPTATPTVSATPTATRLPVIIELGSVTMPPGSRATLPVVLRANGASVAAVQNDISFAGEVRIATAANGAPDCTVNQAIGKPNTAFVFRPNGCDYGRGQCTGIRAVVYSIDDVNAIADGALLYTCVVEVSPASPAGTFTLRASAVFVSDERGTSLAAVAVDGSVSVNPAPAWQPPPTAAATATATDSPMPVASPPTPSALGGIRAADAGAPSDALKPHAANGSGCSTSTGATHGQVYSPWARCCLPVRQGSAHATTTTRSGSRLRAAVLVRTLQLMLSRIVAVNF